MKNVYAGLPCLFFSSTDDGVLVEVNDTLCHHLQYEYTELIGQKTEKIFPVSTRIFFQTHFFPLMKMQGYAEEIFVTLQAKDKTQLPVLLNATRQPGDSKTISLYAGIVVRNRKTFEDELLAAKKAAEKALQENTALLAAQRELQARTELLDQQMSLVNKQNEALRQYNHIVTHELQEPLRKLFFFTNILVENEDAESSNKNIQKLRSVAEQMRYTLTGLQQYVWLTETPVKRTPVNVNTLITSVINELQKEAPALTINCSAETLPQAEADSVQLHLLFREVLKNAVSFRKVDEAVTIFVTGSLLQRNKFRSVAGQFSLAPFLKIQIRDNGIGFDPAYQEQAFELFRRLHANSGRGVGLALCKLVAENHEGSIQIDSQPGEGTTVSMLLPFLLGDGEATANEAKTVAEKITN